MRRCLWCSSNCPRAGAAVADVAISQRPILARRAKRGRPLEDEADRRMLAEVLAEARLQGPGGFIDDWFADAHDWGFAVEDIRVPTRIMGGLEDTPFMRENSR